MPEFLKKSGIKDSNGEFWKILVVDDEPDVHAITSVVARDIEFEGKKVKLYSAFSADEAKKILTQVPDIALAMIDVVMEKDTSGLDLVRYIREELKNPYVRLVIRTGQPGFAPPREIVLKYDINDYREKAELSSNGLYTMIIARLREYRDIIELDTQRKLLERSAFYSSVVLNSNVEDFDDVLAEAFDNFSKILGLTVRIEKLSEVRADKFNGNAYSTNVSWNESKSVEFVLRKEIGLGERIRVDFSKPLTRHQSELMTMFLERYLSAVNNYVLSKDLIETLYKIIYIISEVTETRSLETGEHVRRVGKLSRLIASKLGYEGEYLEFFEIAAMLHDVGKIGIPDAILNKPAKLSDEEFEIMKRHTIIGYNILASVEHPLFKLAANIALYHHENWDGTGYPKGLKGEQIPLEGRIVSIVDVYDALLSDRIYRPAWSEDDTIRYIKDSCAKKFDSKVCDVFFKNYDEVRGIYGLKK
ncbi:Response regulator c-di-GMP phosphodiesterase, RpfG family, contains REC and HD-GYP domains [Fervidobacterium changbaicum]|uniref:HD domain-containing protein n=1 Tax=Fervidobacterium changbaicum TaxID=310769 RepID=A0ABX5QSQ5_9BACT|nr:HD domain-containing phosphohydrolase [Fervidobacterium changbaicum]QAV33526.1 HD domain-containing protein [Fervidobacterium changbaicum]SDH62931.1 Response regulator c-di-GMP phosphodiesterase, RpfG family, contains REC and HD-GYP domains [Fervidobacterium changbaicum]